MPIIGPDGLPIIGTKSPQDVFVEEKSNLSDTDHDWIIIVEYGILNEQAPRVIESRETGAPADPPIRLELWNMGNVLGPICRKCQEPYEVVHGTECPGISFEAYIASLDPAMRERVLEALARRADAVEEATVSTVPVSAVDGYDYTLDDGTVVHQPPIPNVFEEN